MSKERFQVTKDDSSIGILTPPYTRSVKIKDTKTGNEARENGPTYESAEQRAWDKLEKIQGPTSSKPGKK